ncbi:MAG TPA: class I SAM-dependent methyltransferase [Opitutaceae bacterium]|nr:class I SAM-dependent methyltransferase [Opitutaceae bacterium]
MSFDRLAPHYTWMEKILAGSRLQRCRVTWLDALSGCETILIAGVGHGHFLQRCAERFPAARITSVDSSAGMLRHAERRVCRAPRLERMEFVHAQLPEWQPPAGRFDAIVTHFFLDCFPPHELGRVIGRLAASARPTARWLVADFAVPESGLARLRAKAVHAVMYGFFRRVTGIPAHSLTEPSPFLMAQGFKLTRQRASEWGLLRSELWLRHASD